MSLRRKTILLMLATLAALILLLYLVLRMLLLDSYGTLERQVVERNLERATVNFQDNADHMERAIHDWSSWDDTYRFARDGNTAYVDANLTDSTFWSLDINMMMVVDTSSQIVYAKAIDLDGDWDGDMLTGVERFVRSQPNFLGSMSTQPRSGFVLINDLPVLVAARPVLHSDDSGPSAGILLWGRVYGANEMAQLTRLLRLSLDLRAFDAPDLPADIRAAQKRMTPISSPIIIPLDDSTVAGYCAVSDLFDQPALILRVSQNRDIYWQGQSSLTYFTIALIVGGLVFAAGVLMLLERLVLAPLAHLNQHVQLIGASSDLTTRLPVTGGDELAQLARAINTMLNSLAQSRDMLYQSNTKLEIGVRQRTVELEHQRSQLEAIMETMGEGLAYCVNGSIAYVNPALAELLDYPVSEMVGKPLSLLCPQLDATAFRQPLHDYQTTCKRRDGASFDVAVTSTLVNDSDAEAGTVIIIRDITQELAIKVQKDRFFARASHDLRSPLTSLMTRLYLLGKRPDQLEMHLSALNYVADHMLELVNDLLDVSRIEQAEITVKRRDLVLQSLVEQVVDLQRPDAELKQIHLRAQLPEAPLHVSGDPMRLNQVITNLVSNAIHYTDAGGDIVVSMKEEKGSPCRVVIRVSDTGIGISPQHLPRIFDAFFRVSDERGSGSGLGLYIVKEIVALHGGEVAVESELGKGTTFSVRLNLLNEELCA
jgi:PAS domain S-box-containing protein